MTKKLLAMMTLIAVLALPAARVLAEDAAQIHGVKAGEDAQPGLLDVSVGAVIWVLIIFVLLAIILYRTAWKNVLNGLKAREERIRKDISDAEEARLKAEATLREYQAQLATAEQKVRDILQKATTDAEALGQTIRARAQQEAEESKERAMNEIEAAREQALTDIYQQTADLATRVAEKILRRTLNADDQRDLVERSLNEVSSVSHS